MDRIIIIVILFLIINSCVEKKNVDYIIISGKIENPNSDKLSIVSSRNEIIHTFNLKSDNTFIDTLNIFEGYFFFFDKKPIPIYLKPSYNLELLIDTKSSKYVEYKGKGANENNYLIEQNTLKESFRQLNYYGYYAKFNEKTFLKQTDSIYKLRKVFFKKRSNLEKEFIYLEDKSLEYEKLDRIASYEMMHGFITKNQNFKVSDNFPSPYKNIDLNDEKLSISPYYIGFLEGYLRKLTFLKLEKNNSSDPILKSLESIEENVKSPILREVLAYNVVKNNLKRSKNVAVAFKKYNEITNNEKHKEKIKQVYVKLSKIAKGGISPDFKLLDIDDNLISLSDLTGKYIYIDIWATWCGPCIAEIPALKKIEKHFKGKNIQFVSISFRDKKELWKKMVKEKELGGLQLFAPDENISFFKEYQVTEIPRFILIDKKGKIIYANAIRPSNPKLKIELEELLQ